MGFSFRQQQQQPTMVHYTHTITSGGVSFRFSFSCDYDSYCAIICAHEINRSLTRCLIRLKIKCTPIVWYYIWNPFLFVYIVLFSLQERGKLCCCSENLYNLLLDFATQKIDSTPQMVRLVFLIWFLSRFTSNLQTDRAFVCKTVAQLHFELHFRRRSSFFSSIN